MNSHFPERQYNNIVYTFYQRIIDLTFSGVSGVYLAAHVTFKSEPFEQDLNSDECC